jgi:hypothetical protein
MSQVYFIAKDARSFDLVSVDDVIEDPDKYPHSHVFFANPDSNPYLTKIDGAYHFRGDSLEICDHAWTYIKDNDGSGRDCSYYECDLCGANRYPEDMKPTEEN